MFPFLGARLEGDGVRFRVWAPEKRSVTLQVEGRDVDMERQEDGHWTALVKDAKAGQRYGYRLDGHDEVLPDLASAWQPDGATGLSAIVSHEWQWTDREWRGPKRTGQVAYELHVGTFTQEGTWTAARARLEHLAKLGVTMVEVMPIGQFTGDFGWGYDTMQHFAPYHHYGTPDDVRAFVDHAHGLGLAVILDVVYNHVGMGDRFADFSPYYFSETHDTEWGKPHNFDGRNSRPVRDFVIANVVQWIRDYHFDGLRLDATQALFDDSDDHIMAEITRAARKAAGGRSVYVLAENQPEDRRLIDPPEEGGYGLDALCNDDFHHAARVALTGHHDFYYGDYSGSPQEIVSSLKYGFLYQGQRSAQRDAAYGTFNLDTAPDRLVTFLENHDQVANSARGWRLAQMASPGRIRAISTLFLLGPQTPMFFQGQEWGATNPFYYFLGVGEEHADAIMNGRLDQLQRFPGVSDKSMQAMMARPTDPKTFTASKLDWTECERHQPMLQFHTDLLRLRRETDAFGSEHGRRIDGAVLGSSAVLLRFFAPDPAEDRLVMVNWGSDLHIDVLAEPLMAPPRRKAWSLAWSSDDPVYGGGGTWPADLNKEWVLPADTALVFAGKPQGSE